MSYWVAVIERVGSAPVLHVGSREYVEPFFWANTGGVDLVWASFGPVEAWSGREDPVPSRCGNRACRCMNPPKPFDPPSHDGTDPWKWEGSRE